MSEAQKAAPDTATKAPEAPKPVKDLVKDALKDGKISKEELSAIQDRYEAEKGKITDDTKQGLEQLGTLIKEAMGEMLKDGYSVSSEKDIKALEANGFTVDAKLKERFKEGAKDAGKVVVEAKADDKGAVTIVEITGFNNALNDDSSRERKLGDVYALFGGEKAADAAKFLKTPEAASALFTDGGKVGSAIKNLEGGITKIGHGETPFDEQFNQAMIALTGNQMDATINTPADAKKAAEFLKGLQGKIETAIAEAAKKPKDAAEKTPDLYGMDAATKETLKSGEISIGEIDKNNKRPLVLPKGATATHNGNKLSEDNIRALSLDSDVLKVTARRLENGSVEITADNKNKTKDVVVVTLAKKEAAVTPAAAPAAAAPAVAAAAPAAPTAAPAAKKTAEKGGEYVSKRVELSKNTLEKSSTKVNELLKDDKATGIDKDALMKGNIADVRKLQLAIGMSINEADGVFGKNSAAKLEAATSVTAVSDKDIKAAYDASAARYSKRSK